jgi:hypothetical protein
VDGVDVTFTEPINVSSFGPEDLTLTRDAVRLVISNLVTVQAISSNLFHISRLSDVTAPIGNYVLGLGTEGIQDRAGNAGLGSVSVTWRRSEPNCAPTLAAISDRIIGPNTSLVFTNVATDCNVPADALSFSLAPGAPVTMRLNPATGILTWRPAAADAGRIFTITVIVTDNGDPPLSDSHSFMVRVLDLVVVSLGSAVARAGETSAVPVTIFSSGGLTNLSFALDVPPDRLTNFVLRPLAGQLSTPVTETLSRTRSQVRLATRPGQALQGTQQLAELNFSIQPSQRSAFVPLQLSNVVALKSDGANIAAALTQNGRVAVVADEPLVESISRPGGKVGLLVYGKPDTRYVIQTNSDLGDPRRWQTASSVLLTTLFETVGDITPQYPRLFYRAVESPSLNILGLEYDATNRVARIRVSARPGTSCELQASEDLQFWSPISTNQVIGGVDTLTDFGAGARSRRFYRIRYHVP